MNFKIITTLILLIFVTSCFQTEPPRGRENKKEQTQAPVNSVKPTQITPRALRPRPNSQVNQPQTQRSRSTDQVEKNDDLPKLKYPGFQKQLFEALKTEYINELSNSVPKTVLESDEFKELMTINNKFVIRDLNKITDNVIKGIVKRYAIDAMFLDHLKESDSTAVKRYDDTSVIRYKNPD